MRIRKIHLALVNIHGLNSEPYYFSHRCFYVWGIMFSNAPVFALNNMPYIKVGDTPDEAKRYCNKIKCNFSKAMINDGDSVAVIFGNDGCARAIGRLGKDLWIDVTDNFSIKTFKQLNVSITSLTVH